MERVKSDDLQVIARHTVLRMKEQKEPVARLHQDPKGERCRTSRLVLISSGRGRTHSNEPLATAQPRRKNVRIVSQKAQSPSATMRNFTPILSRPDLSVKTQAHDAFSHYEGRKTSWGRWTVLYRASVVIENGGYKGRR